MGCAQSKIDNEEAVARSKDRRNLMKDAVSARNAFASGHSGYSFALKNVGAALSDFAHGEAEEEDNQEHIEQPLDTNPPPPPPPPHSSLDPLPPPPPPLPNFSPSPIKRAVSMPTISKNKKHPMEFDNVPITEDEEEEEDEDDENDDVDDDDDEEEGDDGSNSEKNKNKNKIGGPHGDLASASTSSPRTPGMRPMPSTAWDYFFLVDDHLAGSSLNDTEEEEEEPHMNNASTMEENMENVNANVFNKSINVNNIINNNIRIDDSKNVDNFMKNDGDINVREPKKAEEKAEGKAVIEHASTAPLEFGGGRRAVSTVSLMQVLNQIDDHFLKSSQSAKDVSNMLEANRLHYHSNFADNRGNFSV